jgi:hypothetical protein
VTPLALALGCQGEVINGYPLGHAILEGAVLRQGGVPYSGQLFVTCAESAAAYGTRAPGQYRIELSWDFPAGVPADSIACTVRAGQPGQPAFTATRRVLFVPQNIPANAHTLDVIEP